MVLVIMKGRKFKIFKMYHQAGYQGKRWYFSSSPKTVCRHISLLLRGSHLFFFLVWFFFKLIQAHCRWQYAFSKFINLHVTLKHILLETFRISFDHVSEHHGPAKLTHAVETINLTIISGVTVTPTLSDWLNT